MNLDKYMDHDTWYHATTLEGWESICNLGIKVDYNINHELDFGFGFYLAYEQNKAEEYINRLLRYNIDKDLGVPIKISPKKKIPVVIEFGFTPSEILLNADYNYKFFPSYNDDFADFVFYNRLNNVDGSHQHTYDIILGVMSDSNPPILLEQYRNNLISKDKVIEEMKKSTSMKQISLHNQDICDKIKPRKAYIVNTREELNINDYHHR